MIAKGGDFKTKVVCTCADDPRQKDLIASFIRATHTERRPSCTSKCGCKNNNKVICCALNSKAKDQNDL
jgi:hypothetical protein